MMNDIISKVKLHMSRAKLAKNEINSLKKP